MTSAFSHVRSIATQTTNSVNAVQYFHRNIWKAVVGRSLRRSMQAPSILWSSSRLSETPCSIQNEAIDQNSKDVNAAAILRKNSREDLFKHFRMSACMRAMKRGDGVLSENFFLGKNTILSSRNDYMPHFYQEGAVQPEFQPLSGMPPQKIERENYQRHFWKERQERKAIVYNSNGSSGSLYQHKQMNESIKDDMAAAVHRKNARADLFKHFRMNAGLRAMKRGDGVLSKYFSFENKYLNTLKQDEQYPKKVEIHHEFPSDVHAASKSAVSEQLRHHFWKSHEERKSIINARDKENARVANKSTSVPRAALQAQNKIPLPTSLNDAYKEFFSNRTVHQPRAMAITEIQPPFKIIDVNKAWVDLCGYSREQAVGSTIKALLHGPETNLAVARSLVSRLVDIDAIDESEAVVVNYRSDGRKFRNHVRVGALRDEESGNVTHLVGVFCKIGGNLNDEFYANV